MSAARNDPRVKMLLKKATIEHLMKMYFQRIYGNDEIQQMENGLKKALEKYEDIENIYDKMFEQNEKAVESEMNECLQKLCEKDLSPGKKHTPQSLLELAKFFLQISDYRLASEVIWGGGSLAITDFIKEHGLKVRLNSHKGKSRFVVALSKDISKNFYVLESCHSAFYTNVKNRDEIKFAMECAKEFLEQLQSFNIDDEMKKKLESKYYDD